MASVTIPLMRLLEKPGVLMGHCLACRSQILVAEEMTDFGWEERIGFMCKCRSCFLTEYENPLSMGWNAMDKPETRYHRLRFRLRMLTWQWQTGRTLAGYWRSE
jgi:hypothetical protein